MAPVSMEARRSKAGVEARSAPAIFRSTSRMKSTSGVAGPRAGQVAPARARGGSEGAGGVGYGRVVCFRGRREHRGVLDMVRGADETCALRRHAPAARGGYEAQLGDRSVGRVV